MTAQEVLTTMRDELALLDRDLRAAHVCLACGLPTCGLEWPDQPSGLCACPPGGRYEQPVLEWYGVPDAT